MKRKLTNVEIETITTGRNVRLPNRYSVDPLADSIAQSGLHTPITVYQKGQGFEVIAGHRRLKAIRQIGQDSPSRFDELFGKGIPCTVLEGISADEAAVMKALDGGNQFVPNDPHEVFLASEILFDAGQSEADVAVGLSGLIDQIAPMSSKNREKLAEIEARLKEAQDRDEVVKVQMITKERREFIAKNRRGYVQGLKNLWRSPDKVKAARYYHACKVVPDGFEGEYLPKLTNDHVAKLWKAHATDISEMDVNGAPKYNKEIPGPAFKALWAAIVKEEQDNENNPPAPKPKAMSAKDIAEELKNGKYKALLSIKLCQYHTGTKEAAEDLTGLDSKAYSAELVEKHDPELWIMVVESAEKIKAQLKAESTTEAEVEG